MWKTGKYNIHTLMLAGFKCVVFWESAESGFKVSFGDWSLKTRFQSLDKAKEAAVALATRKAEELLAAVVALKK